MSETKFTKGEWWVNNIGNHHNNPNIDNLQICYSLAEECICDTVYELADAHLIAAAPEMYGVLNELSHTFEVLSNKIKVYEYDHEFKKIKAVLDDTLAKARGEK